jgi:hypothetical protein
MSLMLSEATAKRTIVMRTEELNTSGVHASHNSVQKFVVELHSELIAEQSVPAPAFTC